MPTPAPYRDRDFLRAIAKRLNDTGQFDAVTTSGPPEDRGQSAENLKLAGLELASFIEVSAESDYAALPQRRTVSYTLHLYVRNPDPDARDDELDRLAQVAGNALTFAGLLSENAPDLCTCGRGNYGAGTSVERRLTMYGSFVYLIPDTNARNETP
mgnify:CR=1 FL=1